MNAPVKYGLILGFVVGVLGFVVAGLGLHTNLVAPTVFVGVSVVVNVVIVFLALRETAAASSWAGQLLNSLILGAIGAAIVFASSWIMTTVVFPDYYAEYAAAMLSALTSAGMPSDQVAAAVAQVEQTTPAGSALQGALGTVITSLVVGAIVGIFKRQGK